ncbi:PEP-utilizing protein [Acidimicrobium ferrooxidans DSM 10331]|uniref:Phosphoenolpyruvate-protein phosphotransferase n=1 Tax=Acidimicrobium ferrooxidans (strain DSM 10331 / JCM 15462 / NBRC 103882 / ICP) TaxID=525909 RepID=C7LYL1_ACIFD|nr:putative PEP-binding protein [Acidimicrobium ferrooxidans]ACU53819.1 PEP-utilizing protein [Acidimicrobium ferrooxidans DSM 10331]
MPERHTLRGQPGSQGAGVGTAVRVDAVAERTEVDPASVRRALEEVADDLEASSRRASGELSQILAADAAIARDPMLVDAVERHLADDPSTVGVHDAFDEVAGVLRSVGGAIAERAADLGAIERRLIARLRGTQGPMLEGKVVVANELGPADLLAIEHERPAALLLAGASPTAHVAILARALGIPALTGVVGLDGVHDGDTVLVDTVRAVAIVNPNDDDVTGLRAAERTPARTTLPRDRAAIGAVAIMANVAGVADAQGAIDAGAVGIGLLRTEFLFLDRDEAPSRAEQAEAYTEILTPFRGRRCIVRTLDAGADKPLAFIDLPRSANPALGVRGWRARAVAPAVIDTQIAAIADAQRATGAEVGLMAPMVTTIDEAREVVERAHAAGIPSAGVMVEVPALCLLGDELARSVDFVSIGTNDLAQYLFAADREESAVAALADPFSPPLARLLARLVDDVDGRIPIGVCGELAADPLAAVWLAGLGITSLSMTPSAIAPVTRLLASVERTTARRAAEAVRTASDAQRARDAAARIVGLA